MKNLILLLLILHTFPSFLFSRFVIKTRQRENRSKKICALTRNSFTFLNETKTACGPAIPKNKRREKYRKANKRRGKRAFKAPAKISGGEKSYAKNKNEQKNKISGLTGNEYLIISEIADPKNNYKARFVELSNIGQSNINLANYYFSKQTNGSASKWTDFHLSGNLPAGETYVIAYKAQNFQTAFGFAPDTAISSLYRLTGNDGVFLFKNGDHSTGTLIDAYGVIDENGTGKAWEYTDKRAYRKWSVSKANPVWTSSEWCIESVDTSLMTPGNYPEITDTTLVSAAGEYNLNYQNTGLKITFSGVTGTSNFSVNYYKGSGPKFPGGIAELNKSKYGWYISYNHSTISFSTANLKFFIAALPNNSIPEGAGNIKLYKRETFGAGNFTLVGTLTYHDNGTSGNLNDDWLEYDGITQFSEFVFASDNYLLPVELTTFTASVSGNKVALKWQTATEVNNYGFEIQRAIVLPNEEKNLNWNKIGFVKGNGTSNSPKEYSFTDVVLQCGNYSYRLKQIDIDGKYKYSKIIKVTIEPPKKFELSQNYPNPFNPTTTINYTIPESISGNKTSGSTIRVILKIYDALGREIATLVNKKQTPGNYEVKFNAENLSAGIYFCRIIAGNNISTKKMILVK